MRATTQDDRHFSVGVKMAVKKVRVLLASDYALPRIALRKLLETESDIDVVGESHEIENASREITELHPDVIFMEIAVPGPHGLRSTTRIVQRFPDARVVILTNNTNAGYVRSILAAGAYGYVLKQSTEVEMLLAIRTVARGRHYLDPNLSDAITQVVLGTAERESSGTKLSDRELQVLKRIARGFTNQEIAHELQLSTKTVETYRARIYYKLKLRSRAELVEYAFAVGLLTSDQM
ncbi:MAG TPA: response regulator transcription factor [Terriglobales bacterium]|nr:response regulator transcription factor [Terriglobales bacterium]